jgi:hypothetical protein
MAKDSDRLAGNLGTQNTGGLLTGFLAEENEFDRRALWRLGSWGAAAVGAVVVAALANQTSVGQRREQLAAADLSRQATQLQLAARESQSETRRLASAVDTLNTDRDRLYSRMTALEQGLDSMTGALARQTLPAAKTATVPTVEASPSTPAPASPPAVAPVSTTAAVVTERPKTEEKAAVQSQPVPPPGQPQSSAAPQPPTPSATPAAAALPKIVSNSAPAITSPEPLSAPKSMMGPPDPAATKLIEPPKPAPLAAPAAAPDNATSTPASATDAAGGPSAPVQRVEFAVDLGSANTVGGLRALWRGLAKSNSELAALRPIIVVRERSNGLGMQLRLAAGPVSDAAAAAKICASLTESERSCETTLFDGQRLSLQVDDKPEQAPAPVARPGQSRRGTQKRVRQEEPPAPAPVAKPEPPSTLSTLFGRR